MSRVLLLAVVAAAALPSVSWAQTIEEPARAALVDIALDCRTAQRFHAADRPIEPVAALLSADAACDRALRLFALLPSADRPAEGSGLVDDVASAFDESARQSRRRVDGNDLPVQRSEAAAALGIALDVLDADLRK